MPNGDGLGDEPDDGDDDVDQDIADATAGSIDEGGEEGNTMYSCVKMKLASFCPNPVLRSMIIAATLTTNDVVGEAYAFANYHLTRMLESDQPTPPINRTFYYACLGCVSKMNTRVATIPAVMLASATEFDNLRPAGTERLDATDLMDLMADISISMATMATNHLWMNLCTRLTRYLTWKYPDVKKKMRRVIVCFAVKFPGMALDKVDQLKLTRPAPVKGNKTATEPFPESVLHARQTARCIIKELRSICPLPNGKHVATRAHHLISLYRIIHSEGEQALKLDRDSSSQGNKKLPSVRALKRFTLLPMKSGYTVSHIPVSIRFMTTLVQRLKSPSGKSQDKLTGSRGTEKEQKMLWRKYFNVNAVETKTRKFDDRISSDGVSITVIMQAKQALVHSNISEVWDPSVLPKNGRKINHNGTDPGVTDVVTATIMNGKGEMKTVSYSSSRYYEKAKVKMTGRRTKKWNEELKPEIDNSPDLSTVEGISIKTRSYLASVRQLHAHRATKGYRNMRFLRYRYKQKAISEICDLMAPPSEFTVVGFGDWSGPNGTPIKRKFCGPLQEIKKELKRRTASVAFRPIWEFKTSVLDSNTWTRMENMKAKSWSRNRENEMIEKKSSKIHKVMHCQNSHPDAPRPRITTWNRDVNASRNILMLLMMEVRGFERPDQFKPTQLPSRRGRAKVPAVHVAAGAAATLSLGSS
jgi:hypothetical protein